MSDQPTTVFQEDVTASVDVVLQDKLDKANITDHTLSELRSELTDLAGIKVEDKRSLALVQGGISKAVNIRNNIVRICKKGREAAIMEQKAWIAKERELVAVVEAVEKPLVALKEAYNAEQERIVREELEAQERVIKERFVAIEKFDFMRKTGTEGREDYYSNGTTILEIHQVSMAGEEEWKNILKGVELAYNEEQDRKAEAERIAAEEVDRVRKAQEDLERREREMKEKEDRMNAQVNEVRKNELLVIGYIEKEGELECVIPDAVRPKRYAYIAAELFAYNEEAWNEEKEMAIASRMEYEVVVERSRVSAERQALVVSRVKALYAVEYTLQKTMGGDQLMLDHANGTSHVIVHELGDMEAGVFNEYIAIGQAELARRKQAEQYRIAQEAVRKEQERVQQEAERAKEAEAERLAQMGDAELLEEMGKHIIATSAAIAEGLNKCKSATAKLGIRKAIGHLGDAGTVITGTIKDLK